ncbi:MAG: hypothetical protein II997_05740 [Clostridia bacterium]|nr:hypothetical protein [Clostridia bacterium]
MKNYVFERFSDDWRRMINQNGVKCNMVKKEGNENLNAVWDGMVAPDGRFYYPLSSEAGLCGITKLAWYDFENDEVHECFDGAKVLMPNDRKLPHSKFHTSLNTMPRSAFYPEEAYDPKDYLVIGTTHATDRAKHHDEWMPFGHHNHVWEGFPGSQIVMYDPKKGHAISLGIPVPQETIYGAKYDPKHNRLYMIGFMRGHVYCYDFNERRVIKDLGKAAEVFTYRLVLGSDGHIYGCSKSGQLFRINTDTIELENLDFHVPDFKDNYISYTWYRYMVSGRNHSSGKYLYFSIAALDTMYKLEFATGKVTELGSCLPKDGLYEPPAKDGSWQILGFDIDKDGVLWLAVQQWCMRNDTKYNFPSAAYLIRWDVDNGEEPYCCGILGTKERVHECVSEMEYDHVHDVLYWTNTATERPLGQDRPTVGGIDLKVFRKHYKEPGPITTDSWMDVYELSAEEIEAKRIKFEKRAREENTAKNPFFAFPPESLTPVRIWRSFPSKEVENSQVIGMAFDKETKGYDYLLHVVCGQGGLFETADSVLTIADGKVIEQKKFTELDAEYHQWLKENILPQPPALDEQITLPEVTGRRYRAKASCVVPWQDGKQFVGTLDAILALVSPDGNVFSLGNAAAYGPIRSMVANKDKTRLWGVAGDDEDMGYVFSYDDKNGLRQLGILNYNTYGYYDGPVALNVLSSITISPDDKYLAIGSKDRIAMVCIIKL